MSNDVNRLKELLFDGERATLSDLKRRIELVAEAERRNASDLAQKVQQVAQSSEEQRRELVQRLEQVFERAGSNERFRAAVAAVIDGALRDAEVERHDELARALAPMVVRHFRAELKNSEQDIVNLLYPHTGRMVQSYVQRAMRDLVDEINRKLDKGVASNSLMLRLKSWSTGRPMAELALAAAQRPQVSDLFLIRRGSGELIQRWPAGAELSNSDIQMSGLVTAINDFAASAFRDDGGAIRSFELDNAEIYLRASPTFLLVAKVKGAELPNAEAMIDETFLSIMERHRDVLVQPAGARSRDDAKQAVAPVLDTLASDLDSRFLRKHQELIGPPGLGFNPVLALAWLIGIPVAAYLAWNLYADFQTARARSTAMQVIAAAGEQRLLRPELEVGRFGSTIRVGGIAPSLDARAAAVTRLQAALPSSTIVDEIEVLPDAMRDIEPQIANVRRNLAGLEVEMVRTNLARAVDRSQRRLDTAVADLRRLQAAAIPDAQKALVREVLAATDQAASEIRLYQSLAADLKGDTGALRTLGPPLWQAGRRLSQASGRLSALMAGTPNFSDPMAAQTSPPEDPQHSAEDLALSTERLATLVLAMLQSANAKPVERIVVEPAPPQEPSPRDRLGAWTRANAVFFANGTDYRAPDQAAASIRALAGLINASGDLVRVIGHTDERGAVNRNLSLAQQRADKVVADLVAAGVPADRLVAVGRPLGSEISLQTGPTSPNRRVEFELGFVGE